MRGGWARNMLSMAGRGALINVLSTMSIHVMAILPVSKGFT